MTTVPNPPMPLQNKHERTYTLLLVIFAFFVIFGAGGLLLIASSLQFDALTRLTVRLSAFMNVWYAVAAVVTLIFRVRGLASAGIVTKAMNILLLPGFPLGTALGIYGLWKLRQSPTINQS